MVVMTRASIDSSGGLVLVPQAGQGDPHGALKLIVAWSIAST